MKLFLILALVAVANADISQLLSKFLPPARSNSQGPSNSLSILPALLQSKQSFSGGRRGSGQQGSFQQGSDQQPEIIKVIHVSASAPQQQQYHSAPQSSYQFAPSNQYLPPVTHFEPVYQSYQVDHQQQVNYQPAPVQNEPVEIQLYVQDVAAPQIHHVQNPQYVQQPQAQYVQHTAPQVRDVQQPQIQYVQPAAPQVQYVQPQAYEAPPKTFQAPAATFNDVSGYAYDAPE